MKSPLRLRSSALVSLVASVASFVIGLSALWRWFTYYERLRSEALIDLHQNSAREIADERFARLERLGWSHDDFNDVGRVGDKEIVKWLIEHSPDGRWHGCLGAVAPHLAEGLAMMTNQMPGQEADDWRTWWQENRQKPQSE